MMRGATGSGADRYLGTDKLRPALSLVRVSTRGGNLVVAPRPLRPS